MNYYRVKKGPEVPEDAFEVLAKHEKVAPVLVPASNDISATANVLWHPDLHLDNIFVDPHSHKITAIIDWQSASVAPLFFQSHVHRAFRHYKPVQEGWVFPEKPDNFDALSPEEQKRIDQDLESEMIHKYFEVQTMERAPAHWNVLQQKTVPILRKPVWLVTGVWENRDLFFLRDSLISIVAQWNDIFGDSSSCPIDFSTEELELHAKEEENIKGVGEALSLFRDKGLLPAHGMVAPEDYESAIENCHKFKEVFLNSAENDTERELYNKLWPYQDVPE